MYQDANSAASPSMYMSHGRLFASGFKAVRHRNADFLQMLLYWHFLTDKKASLVATGIEPLRAVLGAGADTLLSPANLAEWQPPRQKPAWYDKKPSVEAAAD